MKCKYCKAACVKRGVRLGIQKYSCKSCKKYQQKEYQRKPLSFSDKLQIKVLLADRVSFRGVGRFLNCSASTVQHHVLKMPLIVKAPWRGEFNQEYEIDKMCSYVSRNNVESRVWITYAINRKTKDIIAVAVGRRNNETISKVTNAVLNLHPKMVYTDKYIGYKSLIPPGIHCTKRSKTNCIERMNLTIRNRISRLSRKTLSFPKSRKMTEATILLFFDQIGWSFAKTNY